MKRFKDILFVFCAVAIAVTSIAAALIFRFKSEESSFTRDDGSESRSMRQSGGIPDDDHSFFIDRTDPEGEEVRPVKLEFRLVHPKNDTVVPRYLEYIREGGDPATCPYVPYSEAEILSEDPVPYELLKTEYVLVEKEVRMMGNDIKDSSVTMNEFGQHEILLFFNRKGAAEFGELTGRNVGRRLAIVLDGQLYSAPVLRSKIDGGTAVICGFFSREEAESVSAALKSGALPFDISIESRSYDDAASCAEFLLYLRPDGFDESQYEMFRDNAVKTLRRRLKDRNYRNAEVTPVAEQFVSVRVPSVSPDDRRNLEKLLLRSGRLEFRLVHPKNDTVVPRYIEYIREGGDPAICPYVPYGEAEILTEDPLADEQLRTEYVLVEKEVRMMGDDIKDSYVTKNVFGKYEIMVFFNRKGTAEFGELTGANVGRRLAIVIDGRLYSAPVLRSKIDGGKAVITGDFSLEEARRISAALRRGKRSERKD